MTSESIRLTRESLYEQVWIKPTTKLAKELGISDVALGKICRKLNVPKPPPGMWRRIESGQRIKKPPLPRLKPNQETEVTIWPRRTDVTSRDPEIVALKEAERQPDKCIEVADNFQNSHKLVRETRKAFNMIRGNDSRVPPEYWKIQKLDLRVSDKMLNRALRIMNALLKAFEDREFSVDVSRENPQSTFVIINGQKVKIRLWEKDTRSERQLTKEEKRKSDGYIYDRWIFTPSGKLTFTIDEYWDGCARKNWTDKHEKPLEGQLNDIAVGVVMAAKALRARTVRWQEQMRLDRDAVIRREVAECRRKAETERQQELERQAESWIRSRNILAFIDAWKKALETLGPIVSGSTEDQCLQWAVNYACNLDPLNSGLAKTLITTPPNGTPSTC